MMLKTDTTKLNSVKKKDDLEPVIKYWIGHALILYPELSTSAIKHANVCSTTCY